MAKRSKTRKSSPIYKAASSGTHTIGIDLGGTKVWAALVDKKGGILSETRRPTVPPFLKDLDPRENRAEAHPKASEVRQHINYVINAMADAAAEVLAANPKISVHGIGLASAGPMNLLEGTLLYPSNFMGWKKVPIVALLTEALHKRGIKGRVHFQNDAMASALGEGWIGRAKGASTYAVVTVGTGIGSGVILNGKPAQSGGMGSEWGHLLADVSAIRSHRDDWYGRSVEGLASGTGLVRRARARGYHVEGATQLAEAARKGDALAKELFAGAAEGLAALFYGLSLGFHPEVFVISGGMLAIRDLFLPDAIELYRDLMKRMNPQFVCPVQIAKLGTRAGVIGAARLPYLANTVSK